MEEALQLQIGDVTFVPTDNAYADKLISFLKSESGATTTIEFTGKTKRSKFLQLPNEANVSLTGFSFHELDPEAMADPEITKLLNEYERAANIYYEEIREYGGTGKEQEEEMLYPYTMLKDMVRYMSPKQKERFDKLRKKYDMYY